MRKLWDFPGGIHPEENKHQSTGNGIQVPPLPEKLYVPLQQHIGAAAQVNVEPGDRVLKGQLLAAPEGRLSVAVHAPTSGTIDAITPHAVPHPSGMTDWCVVIRPDGTDSWAERQSVDDYHELDAPALLRLIRNAGIAGMGGAGFPTEIKLHPPVDDKVRTLILNGAECEPYITADDMLMRTRAREVVGGLEIMAYILEPEECIIGIEDNKPESIAALRAAVEGTRIEVVVIPTKYPSGGEKQLIQILTGLEVPYQGIPADIGVMCQNVGTAAAVYRAIRHGEPLISRITTLTGEGLEQQTNVESLIGTPIGFLLDQYGFDPARTERLILGGPMMGFTLDNPDVPVIKTTNCVIAGSPREFPAPPPAQPCIRCSMCADSCPMELLPQQLFWFSQSQEFGKAEQHNLFDCIECGACSYVCPSSIPLVQYYRYSKGEIRKQREEQAKSDRARERFEARQARLERDQAEKEAKRKARAEAAAQAQAEKRAQAADMPNTGRQSASAAVQAALARKNASATESKPETDVSHAPTAPSLDELETNLTKAKAKLNTMQGLLKDAEAQGADTEKLARAVAKNQQRVDAAQQALDDASKANPTAKTVAESPIDTADEVPLETLQTNLEKARNKLDTMQSMLDEARQQGADNIEKLERAVTKNKQRVAVAEAALSERELNNASAPEANSKQESVPAVEMAELEDALTKAQAKLDNMQAMLDEATANGNDNGNDNVDKLTRAVAKNHDRVARAQAALDDARNPSSTSA